MTRDDVILTTCIEMLAGMLAENYEVLHHYTMSLIVLIGAIYLCTRKKKNRRM